MKGIEPRSFREGGPVRGNPAQLDARGTVEGRRLIEDDRFRNGDPRLQAILDERINSAREHVGRMILWVYRESRRDDAELVAAFKTPGRKFAAGKSKTLDVHFVERLRSVDGVRRALRGKITHTDSMIFEEFVRDDQLNHVLKSR